MGYFDETCGCAPPPPAPWIAPGIIRAFQVLNEASLLGLDPGEIPLGTFIVIINPTSKTVAYGLVVSVNPGATGWNRYVVIGNGTAGGIIDPNQINWAALPDSNPGPNLPYNNGGNVGIGV